MPTSKTGGGVATPFLTVEKKKVVEHDLIYEKSVLKKWAFYNVCIEIDWGVATPFLTVEKKKVVEHDLIYEKSVLKKWAFYNVCIEIDWGLLPWVRIRQSYP